MLMPTQPGCVTVSIKNQRFFRLADGSCRCFRNPPPECPRRTPVPQQWRKALEDFRRPRSRCPLTLCCMERLRRPAPLDEWPELNARCEGPIGNRKSEMRNPEMAGPSQAVFLSFASYDADAGARCLAPGSASVAGNVIRHGDFPGWEQVENLREGGRVAFAQEFVDDAVEIQAQLVDHHRSLECFFQRAMKETER